MRLPIGMRTAGLGLAFMALAGLSGCLKDGAQGPQGAQGPAGPKGDSGAPGPVSQAECQACHNDNTKILAKQMQYEESVHFKGGNFARSDTACARCHTNEDFTQYVNTGKSPSVAVANPTPPNCRTCHEVHQRYNDSDFTLRVTHPVYLASAKDTEDFGKGNICATCHQPRTSTAAPKVGGDSVNVSSNRWGPHHGTQSAMFAGKVGYEVAGPLAYENSMHTTIVKDGCPQCHMSQTYGDEAGGHQMGLSYPGEGVGAKPVDFTAACVTCHDKAKLTDFNYNGVRDSFTVASDTLRKALIARGLLDSATNLPKPGKRSINQAGAIWNYLLVTEDRSHGVHNYKYIHALLVNSLAALDK